MPTSEDPPLTGDDLLNWRACPRRYWLNRGSVRGLPSGTDASAVSVAVAADAGATDRAVVTLPVLDQALRATFPQAVLIPEPHTPQEWADAIARTRSLLTDLGTGLAGEAEGRALLGACLASDDGVQVRIDVLAAGERGLRLFKLRYATVGDEADVDLVALWLHVAARCGLRIQSLGLMLVDTDFVYPGHGCYAGLFREADLAPVMGSRPVASWLVAMRSCERGAEPEASPDAPCTDHGGCAHIDHCGKRPAASSVPREASLEVLGRDLAAELRELGYADLRSVPEALLPDARRRRAWRAVCSGRPVVDAAVAQVVHDHGYPRSTLSFDTIGFATPIWAGTMPYQMLPFQWTCDVETAPGVMQRHSFLAGSQGDPRRDFAESLLQLLGVGGEGGTGPVYAYNAGFERNRLRELALLFEDLAAPLDALQARIVDLFQLARSYYYHPAMCGSWSFKSVSRALAPDLEADVFDWMGHASPQEAYALSQQGRLGAADLQALRLALLDHGRRQTEVLRQMLAVFAHADADLEHSS